MSSSREPGSGDDLPFDPAPKIFVGGLPFSLTFEEIRAMFEAYGTIIEITVRCPIDSMQRSIYLFWEY